jgi:hypothetical protein
VRSSLVRHARPVALALALAFAGAPLASAADKSPKSLTGAAHARAAKANLSLAVSQEPAATSSSNGGFFRSKKGVAVMVLFAGAVGYTLYSRSEDRVHSQVR